MLNELQGGMKVESEGPLNEELENFSCFSFLQLTTEEKIDPACLDISIAGEEAGTLENPNIDLILQHSTLSSYGKGERTVMDTTYRNGLEIPAESFKWVGKSYDPVDYHFNGKIAAAMFLGRKVKLELYKIAIYKAGGHFDWHMDTTHDDDHQATLLLALNTTWEGGDLVLRVNGVETHVDMRPKPTVSEEVYKGTAVQAVVFYTDTEHKVEPVSNGVRIVLQYDVKVMEGELDEVKSFSDSVLEHVEKLHNLRDREGLSVAVPSAGVVQDIVDIVEELLEEEEEEEVAFALQHLYRKSSIVREYLKGGDALVYEALVDSGLFDVSLHPVLLHEKTDYEGSFQGTEWTFACRSDDMPVKNEEETEKKRKRQTPPIFYVNDASAIKLLTQKNYIESTGNEVQFGVNKYFGGGIFVRKRSVRRNLEA